jgi:multicomponent Na+:H+ antiporter subunit D
LAGIPLFALAGVPPLSGFVAKLAIVQAAFAAGAYWAGAVALVVSLLGLLSIARLWNEVFWKPGPPEPDPAGPIWQQLVPIGALGVLTLLLSVGASPLFEVTSQAALDLLEPEAYVRAVLGEGP